MTKLKENGVIILGKTSLSEWANFRSTNSTDGWNALGGQTYAAYYPDQNPSGSSSGSAVSADLGLALATLGTEVNGYHSLTILDVLLTLTLWKDKRKHSVAQPG